MTDFGIAKAISAAAHRRRRSATPTLTQIGTSHRHADLHGARAGGGGPDADHRADIYAFGVMAYELLAGQPPFQAARRARLLAAHMSESPRDLRSFRSDIPPALADLS